MLGYRSVNAAVEHLRALEKRRHHDKAWRGPGDNASYRGEGRRQRGGRDYPRTACR